MTISLGVIIPFHNNHRGLQWILEMLTPQLRDRDEVIVVDDHSHRPPTLRPQMRRVTVGLVAARERSWEQSGRTKRRMARMRHRHCCVS